MPNMSYCRFENTHGDLLDCLEHILDTDLSDLEHKYRQRLVDVCREIVDTVGDEDLDDYRDPEDEDGE